MHTQNYLILDYHIKSEFYQQKRCEIDLIAYKKAAAVQSSILSASIKLGSG